MTGMTRRSRASCAERRRGRARSTPSARSGRPACRAAAGRTRRGHRTPARPPSTTARAASAVEAGRGRRCGRPAPTWSTCTSSVSPSQSSATDLTQLDVAGGVALDPVLLPAAAPVGARGRWSACGAAPRRPSSRPSAPRRCRTAGRRRRPGRRRRASGGRRRRDQGMRGLTPASFCRVAAPARSRLPRTCAALRASRAVTAPALRRRRRRRWRSGSCWATHEACSPA